MNLREIMQMINWGPYERREVYFAYEMYERYFNFLKNAIAKKTVSAKLSCNNDISRYFKHTFAPDLLPCIQPEIITSELVYYKTITFNLAMLIEMLSPVILKHIENGCYPMQMHRIIIGNELQKVVIDGKLPDKQEEFGMEPYFKIVYCPDISGIAVLP